MLDFPLHEGFFPQIALSADELKYYRRLGKERVAQLVRVIEDADCAYKWTDVATTRRHRDGTGAHCQKAQFLDFHPANKVTVASTLLKASVHIADARVDEVLTAIAKSKTKDFRKTMKYLHGASFIDGRTLFTFPTATTTATARPRPVYSYRAIKWHVMKRKHVRSSGSSSSSSNQSNANPSSSTGSDNRTLDFAYLEYAGKRKPPPGSHVVGFCIQESIAREREIPSLESFGIARGYLARTGIVVSRTHQANMLKVTAICQVDGDVNPLVRSVLEALLQESVCAITRIKGLLERQRVSSLRFVEQWQWVPNADRKACAVCLRGFYFHRKHHCRTCGEVVCSSCAPLRELEEPIFDITQLRVCSVCMASASAAFDSSLPTIGTSGHPESSTSNGDTESYIRGLRSPQHNAYEDMAFQMRETRDRDRRTSDAVVPAAAAIRDRTLYQQQQQQPSPSQAQGAGPRYRNAPIVAPQEKMQALTAVVTHIRDIRDTINLSLSEVEYASGRNGDGDDREGHARPDDDDDGDRSDSDEIFNDIRSRRMHEIRETLESSVHNFDAALANATHAPVYPRKRAAPRPVYPDDTGFTSTRTYHPNDVGGDPNGDDDGDALADDSHAMARPSDCSNYDDNVMTPEQFASVARITFAAARATKQAGEAFLSSCGGSDRDRHSDDDDGDDASVRTPDSVLTGYSDGSQDPYAASNYERVMASYQDEKRSRSLDDSDDVYGLDVHGSGGGDGGNGKLAHYSDRPPLKRTKSINPNPSSTRRASEIFQLERKIEELQRSLEDAQRKLSVFEIDEPDPEQKGPLEIVYEESAQVEIESVFEVFGDRSDDASSSASERGGRRDSITVRPSLSTDKLVTTYDLVTELRGVMNSSEMTKPTGRRSFTKLQPPVLDDPYAHYQAGPHYMYQQRQSLPSFGAGGIMPSPIPRRKSTHPSPTGSLDSVPSASGGGGGKAKHVDLMNNTASSSASGPHGHSFTSSNGVLVGSHVNADTSLESARYRHLMGSAQLLLGDDEDGDLSSDDDDDGGNDDDGDSGSDRFVMMGVLEEPKLRVRSSTEPPHTALFAKPELEPNTPPRRRTGGDRRNTVGEVDETDELRKLMEGLGRPRSNSVPFGSNQLGAAAAAGDAAEKPAWSDNMPNREQSAYHIEQTLREVRSCLSSFLVECPSGRERERKLSSIFKVLRSLHREGVRSKFRTLQHADIRYAKVLKETPSIIRLLKLAGYVSLPQKLTMRRVDQPYIGVILREIQAALKH